MSKRIPLLAGLSAAALLLAACTGNTPTNTAAPSDTTTAGTAAAPAPAPGGNDEPGDKGHHRLLRPAADHGWLGAINSSAQDAAKKYPDIDLKVAEGTNDASQQIAHIETFINDGVDAIVLLPFDGAALTEVAIKAMNAGIIVVNVDREFSTPFAARTTVLGDNYGMGVSAGTYACQLVKDKSLSDPVIAEIAGIDSLPLTQDRSRQASPTR